MTDQPTTAVAEHELPETPGAYDLVFDGFAGGRFDGRYDLLGFGTSHRAGHTHPTERPAPRGGRKCLACRWTEVRIMAPLDDGPDRYVVHTAGRSEVTGEKTLHRILETDSAAEVVVILGGSSGLSRPLPQTALDALAQAAECDEPLERAYDLLIAVQ